MVVVEHLREELEDNLVLEDVSFTLKDDEILTIIGSSGCGKTVLLKSILGLLNPEMGRIYIDGVDITNFTENEYNEFVRPRISMVFQRGALWDSLTIAENVDLALNLRKQLSKKERRQLIHESLDVVGLGDSENLYPEELSGGMIKRAAIARAIAARPKYILYDEPTTGLDPVLANVINELIVKLKNELSIPALVISHDILNLTKFSNRVAMLYHGKIITTCAADKLWEHDNEILQNFLHGKREFK